jgi:hypothetical protein
MLAPYHPTCTVAQKAIQRQYLSEILQQVSWVERKRCSAYLSTSLRLSAAHARVEPVASL